MASMLPPVAGLATGVGGLPHLDPVAACNEVLRIFPQFPYTPTLPNRDPREAIVLCDSEHLPGGVYADGKLGVVRGRDLDAEMEKIYLDFMEENTAGYGWSETYNSGFLAMMQRDLSGVPFLKAQVTGPVTFGMQVVDHDRRPIFYDPQYADVLGKMLALHVRWCEEAMERTGVSKTLIVLNEPYLAALGSSVIALDEDTIRSSWSDIAGMVKGGLGVHCCSNTDWSFVLSLDPAVISFDAYSNAKEFLLYIDEVAAYMERGGVVAWGIVPADAETFQKETPARLVERYRAIRQQVTAVTGEDLFSDRSLLMPSCGIRFATEAEASAIMETTARIASRGAFRP